MENRLKAKIRVLLFTEEKCFGPGIRQVLDGVQSCGSLRKAAMNMNMAYSKAWKMVKNCEKQLGFPLLISKTGGKNGGGATLTEEAARFLTAYEEYCSEIENFGLKLLNEKFEFYNK